MNRKEIKEAAKAKIKGNKWNIIWPMLVISVITSIISGLFGPKLNIDFNNLESLANIKVPTSYYAVNSIVALLSGILSGCYLKYILDFVRTGKFDHNVIIKTLKEKWLNLLIADILVGIIVVLCSLLFVIPGIIMAIAYTYATMIVIDSNLSGTEPLKKSREMMKGYKWDYFVFGLSFIGWCLLIAPTFGLIMIWLFPYMVVANAMYYDKLKQKAGK